MADPNDIFSILLITEGDIVQITLSQLCAGPVPNLTPASFSSGGVSYAMSAMRSAVGYGCLIPKPELDCKLINLDSGYARMNYSWILSRLLRDLIIGAENLVRKRKTGSSTIQMK